MLIFVFRVLECITNVLAIPTGLCNCLLRFGTHYALELCLNLKRYLLSIAGSRPSKQLLFLLPLPESRSPRLRDFTECAIFTYKRISSLWEQASFIISFPYRKNPRKTLLYFLRIMLLLNSSTDNKFIKTLIRSICRAE